MAKCSGGGVELRCVSNILSVFCKLDNSGVIACFTLYMDFQINNFDANGYHPFEGCYPWELNCCVVGV